METDKKPYELSQIAKEALAMRSVPTGVLDRIVAGIFRTEHNFLDLYGAMSDVRGKFSMAVGLLGREDYPLVSKLELVNKYIVPDRIKPDDQDIATELQDDLRLLAIELGIIKPTEEEKKFRKYQLKASEATTPEAHTLRQIYNTFGVAAGADIFYRLMPEFRGVPMDQVKGFLSNWLGEFLKDKPPFDPSDIEVGMQYLSETSFRDCLMTVIKNSCIADYLEHKKAGSDLDDQAIIDAYLGWVREEVETFSDEEVDSIIDDVDRYYKEIFEQQSKPTHIIDELTEGRAFPDLGQGINIKEIQQQRRMVIADRMGFGKSASAILSKEYLGLKTALVITPSAIVDTWTDYLSDAVDADGQQVGYFKKGEAPKVLVIKDQRSLENPENLEESENDEDQESLEGVDLSAYDYIVISQEKLNDNYTPALLATKFDMLIVDEVHKLKNITDGVRAGNLVQIAQNNQGENQYCVMLSGTPIPDKVSDIAILLKLLYPDRFAETDNKELISQIIHGDIIDLRSLLLPRLQMKDLKDMVKMPDLNPRTEYVDLSPEELDVYEALLDEDELPAMTKLELLEAFLINPDKLQTTPGITSTKITAVSQSLRAAFVEKDKVVMFVNRHIEDVIRGDNTILEKLDLPDDVEVLVIHGYTTTEERKSITQRFKQSNGKVLAIFSGDTVDVGLDYSEGERVDHYNNPWTISKKEQQTARVHRPKVKHDVEEVTHIVRGTIEEGIQQYINEKHKAIMKLLYGVPVTEREQQILEADLDNLSVNSELAEYYFSTWDRTQRMYAHGKGIGETKFAEFLKSHAADYAEGYRTRGRRSYESNAARVSGTLINAIAREQKIDLNVAKVLDIASGPQMLKRHLPTQHQEAVISLDINSHHFDDSKGNQIVGSFTKLPVADNSIDFANLSLALHYTKLRTTQQVFETVEALSEISRVLKVGGTAIINEIYSWNFSNQEQFRKLATSLGLRVREEYSGQAQSGTNYQSNVMVLEKISHVTPEPHFELNLELDEKQSRTYYSEKLKELILGLASEQINSAKKLPDSQTPAVRLRDTRKVIGHFTINGTAYPIIFNQEDQQVVNEEQLAETQIQQLKDIYGDIKDIPREEIINNGLVRFFNGKRWILFKKLSGGNGAVVVRY